MPVAKKNQKINSILERGLIAIDETPLKNESANITRKLLLNIKTHEEKIIQFSTQDVELYEAWFRTTFSKLTEKIEDMHRNYQGLAIRWNKILAISDLNQISTEEAYLQNLSEEEISKSGNEKAKEELRKLNQKRDSWIDNKIDEEYSSDFDDVEDECSDDDLKESKKFIILSGIKMMFSHVWNLQPSKVIWKRDGVDFLSMAYLRCNALGEWELFDEAMGLAPVDVINKFKIEFKRNEGIDFDRNIADIKRQSKESVNNTDESEEMEGSFENRTEQFKHEYIDQKKTASVEEQLNLDVELKTINRKLVRKLHPDHCNIKEVNFNWDDLWSQVQAAYNNKGTQKLYEIYYLTEYWSDKCSLSLSEYKTLNTYLEDEITRLKNESAHMNKHPAWGFSKNKSFVALEKRIKKDLTHAHDEIAEKVSDLEHRFWYLDMSSRNFSKSICKSKKRTKCRLNQR